jgi:hypothetical protein
VVLVLELHDDVAERVLIPVADVVEPVVQRERPITPRFIVTSVDLLSPVILRTLLSFSFPLRYSATVTSMPMPLTSWKPASVPSLLPVPRSTRKLNWT